MNIIYSLIFSFKVFIPISDLVANVEKINDNKLKLKWKPLNSFGYVISSYKIYLSINESDFNEIEGSSEKLSIFNQLSMKILFLIPEQLKLPIRIPRIKKIHIMNFQ